jgi:asparagine synthase (glutamine-hydrolysing)
MCGIAGWTTPGSGPVDVVPLAAALDRIAHRGPDGRGIWHEPGIALGHVRLAILDLSDRAAQPMQSRDGRYVLTYNGEIFNFRELAPDLERIGVRPSSSGDTAVLLELLAAFGAERVLPRLEGFFAFALWDRRERTLLIARDRHGIKPLHYELNSDGGLRFGSEIKALVPPGAPVDPYLVTATLLGWGSAFGDHTLFPNIRSLPPGHWLRVGRASAAESGAFFEVPNFIDPDFYETLCAESPERVLDRFDRAFERSIDLRLVSDAPLACLASGGVDSSLVISRVARRVGTSLALYHADVAHDSERPFAEAIARDKKLDLVTVEVSDQSFVDNLALATLHTEIPLIYHPNSVPFFLVCRRAARDGIKVVLTGEGSDEYFLGYPHLIIQRAFQPFRKLADTLQDAAHRALPRAAGLLWPRAVDSAFENLRSLLFRFEPELQDERSRAALNHIRSERDRDLGRVSLNLARGHLLTLLHRNDRLGMASGIESRFPFLGYDLVRLAVNLPSAYKIRRVPRWYNERHPFHVDKWIVREIAAREIGRDLAFRPKKGFPVRTANRMRIDPGLFAGGCIPEWFGLSRAALERVTSRPGAWAYGLLATEVWGRTMQRGESPDAVSELLRRHVRVTEGA